MVRHVWKNYERLAFGKDQLKPVSGKGVDSWGGVGQTLVDSLDTWLGLYDKKTQWCKSLQNRRWARARHLTTPYQTTWETTNWKSVAQGFGWQVCMKSLTEPRRGQRRVSALTRTWMCLGGSTLLGVRVRELLKESFVFFMVSTEMLRQWPAGHHLSSPWKHRYRLTSMHILLVNRVHWKGEHWLNLHWFSISYWFIGY